MTTDRSAAMARRVSIALVLGISLTACTALRAAQTGGTFSFVYATRQADSYYEPHKAYTGLILRDRHPSIDGARLAIQESRILGRSLGMTFALEEAVLAPDDEIGTALENLIGEGRSSVFILDLPVADVQAAGKSFTDRDIMLFNVRNRDDELRGAACSPVLYHTIPSNAMLMDALAQFLYKKGWSDVLSLVGESEADGVMSDAFATSARKFHLEVVDQRPFVLGNDPRLRDQNNIALLTASASYDVVFLADSVGEFGRYVPYQTRLPRPVVGSEGLEANAWHWTWERHGAPQLNGRFEKQANRLMSGYDWAAWMAIKAIMEAMLRTRSTDFDTLVAYMRGDEIVLDGFKGNRLSQPIFLTTGEWVVASAPLEGFLHAKNNLDTLGVDEQESQCHP